MVGFDSSKPTGSPIFCNQFANSDEKLRTKSDFLSVDRSDVNLKTVEITNKAMAENTISSDIYPILSSNTANDPSQISKL